MTAFLNRECIVILRYPPDNVTIAESSDPIFSNTQRQCNQELQWQVAVGCKRGGENNVPVLPVRKGNDRCRLEMVLEVGVQWSTHLGSRNVQQCTQ